MKEHFEFISGEERTEVEPEWYPAGVSPWYREEENYQMEEEIPIHEMTWMDSKDVSTKDLHNAAVHIQR